MTPARIFCVIAIAQLVGCATTPPPAECLKADKDAWEKANGDVIRRQVQYPQSARVNKQTGWALVTLSVNADGTVSEGLIKRSTGILALDTAALNLVNGKFSPPMCGGKRVPMTVDVPVKFVLPE